MVIAFYQNGSAALVLIPFFFGYQLEIGIKDYLYLSFLGLVCTALSHTLFIGSLKEIRTQFASVIAGLEPVYGSIFAFLILKEIPEIRILMGGSLIVGSVLIGTWMRNSDQALRE
jgi:drug/metabolite transporter (DMT)-like permease